MKNNLLDYLVENKKGLKILVCGENIDDVSKYLSDTLQKYTTETKKFVLCLVSKLRKDNILKVTNPDDYSTLVRVTPTGVTNSELFLRKIIEQVAEVKHPFNTIVLDETVYNENDFYDIESGKYYQNTDVSWVFISRTVFDTCPANVDVFIRI